MMFLYIIGILSVIFALRYWINLNKRKAEEAEAERQRARLQEAARNLRSRSNANAASSSSVKQGPKLMFCFGSQTGTAEEFAETLAGEAQDYGFHGQSVDLEDLEPEDLQGKTAVFLIATYGEGEPTDNAKAFIEWLTDESRQQDELDELRFAVFGLGNRSYDHFCKMGHVTDERLAALGATRLYGLGEGDDESSLEEDFDKWKRGLWAPLCAAFGLAMPSSAAGAKHRRRSKMVVHGDAPASSSFKIEQVSAHWAKHAGTAAASSSSSSSAAATPDHKSPCISQILSNVELHTDRSDRSCRHIEVAVQGGLRYETGDHIGVYPENDPGLVEHLLQRLGYAGARSQQVVSFVNLSDSKTFLGPATLHRILTSFCDISSPPRRSVFAGLVEYASDADEKQRLQRLGDPSSEQGTHDYATAIKHDFRAIGEILDMFPSVTVPIDHLVELLPRLAARFYSISSSPKAHPSSISITAVVTNFSTPAGRHHNGVASTWLRDLASSDPIPCFVRTSEFRLPSSPDTHVILIGPGTGYAPFRGFIQDRAVTRGAGKCVLFFGCRARDTDHIYADEMKQFLDQGVLSALHVAYSRETSAKVYVQHKLAEVGAEMWGLIQEGAHIYVCGDGKRMAEDVKNAFILIAKAHGFHSTESASDFITQMQTRKHYQQDVW